MRSDKKCKIRAYLRHYFNAIPDVGRSSVVVGGRLGHMIASRLAILPIVRGRSLPHKQEVYLKIK